MEFSGFFYLNVVVVGYLDSEMKFCHKHSFHFFVIFLKINLNFLRSRILLWEVGYIPKTIQR